MRWVGRRPFEDNKAAVICDAGVGVDGQGGNFCIEVRSKAPWKIDVMIV
jgi:hypothetical protein